VNDFFCWRWARRSTWRSIRVYAYGGAWAAEAWLRDLTTNADRTVATGDGSTPEVALATLSARLEMAEL